MSKFNTPLQDMTDDEKASLFPFEMMLLVPRALWSAFAILVCWGWFAVPMGAPEITLAHAVGLDVLITALTVQSQNAHESYAEKCSRWTLAPAVLLALGWAAHTAQVAGY